MLLAHGCHSKNTETILELSNNLYSKYNAPMKNSNQLDLLDNIRKPDPCKSGGLIGGGHCDWPISKWGCLIGGDRLQILINWGGGFRTNTKNMASGKKGLSNWGVYFNPVYTL